LLSNTLERGALIQCYVTPLKLCMIKQCYNGSHKFSQCFNVFLIILKKIAKKLRNQHRFLCTLSNSWFTISKMQAFYTISNTCNNKGHHNKSIVLMHYNKVHCFKLWFDSHHGLFTIRVL
jgi:hypothetical protein